MTERTCMVSSDARIVCISAMFQKCPLHCIPSASHFLVNEVSRDLSYISKCTSNLHLNAAFCFPIFIPAGFGRHAKVQRDWRILIHIHIVHMIIWRLTESNSFAGTIFNGPVSLCKMENRIRENGKGAGWEVFWFHLKDWRSRCRKQKWRSMASSKDGQCSAQRNVKSAEGQKRKQ